MEFSETEQAVLDLITSKEKVTAVQITEALGPKAVGGLGRLLKNEVIEKKKLREGEGYNTKFVVNYMLKETVKEEEKNV